MSGRGVRAGLGGDLFIAGRLKELLIIRGRNYFPQALEDAVARGLQVSPDAVLAFSVFEEGEERLIVAIEPGRRDEGLTGDAVTRIREQVWNEHEVAVWWGNYYALETIRMLGLDEHDGAVRAGIVHYNTAEEVDRTLDAIASIASSVAA